MSEFWQGYLAAFATVAGLLAAFVIVVLLIAFFQRSQKRTISCGFCNDVEFETPSPFLHWARGLKLDRHMKSEHTQERKDWRADYAEGGVALAQDRKWDRRAGRPVR